jgi:hypothetical protein
MAGLLDTIMAGGGGGQQPDDPELATLQQNFARNQAWAQPGPYTTALSPSDEQAFRTWVAKTGAPFDFSWPPDQSQQDYDMRGFWQAQQAGDPNAVQAASNGHFPDQYKTPYHESFSNQSQYALPNAPIWRGNQLYDSSGRMLFDATQHP